VTKNFGFCVPATPSGCASVSDLGLGNLELHLNHGITATLLIQKRVTFQLARRYCITENESHPLRRTRGRRSQVPEETSGVGALQIQFAPLSRPCVKPEGVDVIVG
jgi:hypothetical protein